VIINVVSVEPGDKTCKVVVERDGQQYTYEVMNKEQLIVCVKNDLAIESDRERLKSLVGQAIKL